MSYNENQRDSMFVFVCVYDQGLPKISNPCNDQGHSDSSDRMHSIHGNSSEKGEGNLHPSLATTVASVE